MASRASSTDVCGSCLAGELVASAFGLGLILPGLLELLLVLLDLLDRAVMLDLDLLQLEGHDHLLLHQLLGGLEVHGQPVQQDLLGGDRRLHFEHVQPGALGIHGKPPHVVRMADLETGGVGEQLLLRGDQRSHQPLDLGRGRGDLALQLHLGHPFIGRHRVEDGQRLPRLDGLEQFHRNVGDAGDTVRSHLTDLALGDADDLKTLGPLIEQPAHRRHGAQPDGHRHHVTQVGAFDHVILLGLFLFHMVARSDLEQLLLHRQADILHPVHFLQLRDELFILGRCSCTMIW